MKRTLLLSAVLALTLVLSGCNKPAGEGSPEGAQSGGGDAAESGSTIPDGLDPMPVDGDAEADALASAQVIFAQQRDSGTWSDVDWAANETAGPILTAYIVVAELEGQVALFEVRADRVAHNLYNYQRAFDSGSIIWTPADQSASPVAQARSEGERASADSVEAAMQDAFPDGGFSVAIYGYRFSYLGNPAVPFNIEVGVDGRMVSAGM